MALFDKIKSVVPNKQPQTPTPPAPPEEVSVKVACWTEEHLAAVQRLRKIDPDWYNKDDELMKKIKDKNVIHRTYKYKYRTHTVGLLPDPKNQKDKNAIKVLFDGEFVGYIPSDQCAKMKKYVNKSGNLKGIVKGGPVRYVHKDYVLDRCYDVELIIENK